MRGACDEPTLTTKPSQSSSSLASSKAKFMESGKLTRQYTYASKWCPTPEHTLFPTFLSTEESNQAPTSLTPSTSLPPLDIDGPQGSQAPTCAPSVDREKADPVRCAAAVVDLSETNELEEFELLEKLTEGSFCGLSSSTVAKMSKDSLLNKFQQHKNCDEEKISVSVPCVREFLPETASVSNVCYREETTDFLGTPAPETTQGLPVPPITHPQVVSRRNSPTCVSQQISVHRSRTSSEDCLSEFDDKLPWKEDTEPQEAEVKEAPSTGAATLATTRSAHFELSEVVLATNGRPPKLSEVAGDEDKELTPTISLPPKDASSAVIRQWIARLEVEVKRFNAENAALSKLRKDREDSLRQLEKERREFEAMKAEQARHFDDFRKEETAKLKKEKKVLSDYHRTLQSMPNKRDREEIERLKQQISDLQAEAALRETRLQGQLTRQRRRIEEMANEKTELLERIKRLEQTRLTLQTSLAEERAQRQLSYSSQGAREDDACGLSSASNKPKSLTEVAQSIKFEPHARSVDRLCTHSAAVSRHSTPPVAKEALGTTRTTLSAAPSYCDLPVVLPGKTSEAPRPTVAVTTLPSGPGDVGDSSSSADGRAQTVADGPVARLQGVHRADSMASDYYTDDASSSNESSGKGNRREQQTDSASLVAGVPRDFSLPGRLSRLALVDSPMREANRGQLTREIRHPDGSIERQYSNGGIILNYANGSVKEIYPDGKTSLVVLFNGDTKLTLSDGSVIYTYASEGTVQTTFPDGTEQTVYKDGRKEITYPPHRRSPVSPTTPRIRSPCFSRPSSCLANLAPVLVEENCLGNGITVRLFSNGDRIIELPNGQREVHCSEFKRRIYPDGTSKTVFKDGRQETCYASGRIRVKDGQGNLLVDTRIAPLSEAVRPTLVVPPPHLLI
uniref:Centromere protein J C-terminal domain-containing protein n=2 Tax=Schistocephalus solidus TaxID=70667 RepID=A0A0X3P2I6_SCHSO